MLDGLSDRLAEVLEETRRIYLHQTGGKLFGKPSNGIESHYLLTGMLSCAACGSVMTIRSRKHGRRRVFVYMCQSNIHGRRRQRQPEQCRNNLPLPMTQADQVILSLIERTLLHPDVVTGTIRECLARLDPSRRASRRQALETERKRLERELANLTTAIAQGGRLASLVAEVEKREAGVRQIAQDLDQLSKTEQLARIDLAEIETKLREHLNDWRGLLTRHIQSGRQVLGKLIPSRLILTPHVEQNETWYSYEGIGRIEPLLAGALPQANLQPWWPQRDLQPSGPRPPLSFAGHSSQALAHLLGFSHRACKATYSTRG